jgi:RNA polymerase sigma-70 factor (ECF subfamily)
MYADAKLLARCKKHDRTAFVELFRLYQKYLYKLCYDYVQNEQDAMDITQEIYIKVFKNISKYDEKLPFHPWLRKIAVNTCINFKRSMKKNVVSMSSNVDNENYLEEVIASGMDVESEVFNRDLGRKIRENIEGLDSKYRMILVLRYYEGLSYEEISSVLKIPLGTVKTNIYRARNLLKEKLKENLEVDL